MRKTTVLKVYGSLRDPKMERLRRRQSDERVEPHSSSMMFKVRQPFISQEVDVSPKIARVSPARQTLHLFKP